MAYEGDGNLLTGGQEHVHLSSRRLVGDFGAMEISSSVVCPRALTTTTIRNIRLTARIARLAAAMMRSAVATLVPPNFCTTSDKAEASSKVFRTRLAYPCRRTWSRWSTGKHDRKPKQRWRARR